MRLAARISDVTTHGGVVMTGAGTVVIGDMPAARVTDAHVCPMVDGARAHVGGTITSGESSVQIVDHPAARVGDACVCSGPPSGISVTVTGPSLNLVDTDGDGKNDAIEVHVVGVDINGSVGGLAVDNELNVGAGAIGITDVDGDGTMDTVNAELSGLDSEAHMTYVEEDGTIHELESDANVLGGEASVSAHADGDGGEASGALSWELAEGEASYEHTDDESTTGGTIGGELVNNEVTGHAEYGADGVAADAEASTTVVGGSVEAHWEDDDGNAASLKNEQRYGHGHASINYGAGPGNRSGGYAAGLDVASGETDVSASVRYGDEIYAIDGSVRGGLGPGVPSIKAGYDANPSDGDIGGEVGGAYSVLSGGVSGGASITDAAAHPGCSGVAPNAIATGCATVIIGD